VSHDAGPAFWQVPCGSAAPFGTSLHTPIVAASAHDWQVPLHAELQQTPCAQNFDRHSVPSAQVLPALLSPHEPAMQTAGVAQSASAAHEPLQTLAPQRYGKHELDDGVTHAPTPSQVDAGVNVVVEVGHVESWQAVPFGYFWHAPAWHLPFAPQPAALVSLHTPAGSLAPVTTFVHVPSVPLIAHDWQAPAQALSQQTPCAQNVDVHSAFAEQDAPGPFVPHEFVRQVLGARQSVLSVQALKHAVPLQTYGLHGSESGATHWPVELHIDGGT
jgi:hypothetical protein